MRPLWFPVRWATIVKTLTSVSLPPTWPLLCRVLSHLQHLMWTRRVCSLGSGSFALVWMSSPYWRGGLRPHNLPHFCTIPRVKATSQIGRNVYCIMGIRRDTGLWVKMNNFMSCSRRMTTQNCPRYVNAYHVGKTFCLYDNLITSLYRSGFT